MAFAVLPGTDKQYQQLRALFAKRTFVALVAGPPGSGKKTAVRHIAAEASLRTHDIEVEHAWPPEVLRTRLAKLGTQPTDDPGSTRHETPGLSTTRRSSRGAPRYGRRSMHTVIV